MSIEVFIKRITFVIVGATVLKNLVKLFSSNFDHFFTFLMYLSLFALSLYIFKVKESVYVKLGYLIYGLWFGLVHYIAIQYFVVLIESKIVIFLLVGSLIFLGGGVLIFLCYSNRSLKKSV